MANLTDRSEARTALRPVTPAHASPGRRMLYADPARLGLVPAPVLAWIAVLVTVLGAASLITTTFSPTSCVITLLGVAVTGALFVRAKVAANPVWERWWSLYAATAQTADAMLYTSNPSPAWFTLSPDGMSAQVVFPDGSSGVRPSHRRKAAEAAQAAWQAIAPSGLTVLYDLPGYAQVNLWHAPSDDIATHAHLAGMQVTAAANAAARRSYDEEGGATAAVEDWDGQRPARVRIEARDGKRLYSYSRETFEDDFVKALARDTDLVADWTWASPHSVVVSLFPAQHHDAERIRCAQQLFLEVRDLIDYAKRDQLTSVRVDGYDHGPLTITVEFNDQPGATPAPHLWPPQLRGKLLEAYPDRVFTAPEFTGQTARLQAVAPSTETGRIAHATAYLETLLSSCTREPVLVSSFTGTPTGSFTAVTTVRSDKVTQSWWRNNVTDEIVEALPGALVQFDIPTSRMAVTRRAQT